MHIDLSIVYAVSGMVAFALNDSISPNNELTVLLKFNF